MAKKREIRGNMGVLLTYLGRLYSTPANAIKEYTSNALDEWLKARDRVSGPCEVTYSLEKSRITIEYNSPGMEEKEFEVALNRVADSMKRELSVPQIGELGIGIFAFNQVGSHCTFYSKKDRGSPTVKVVLTSNSDRYEMEKAGKEESRETPGMTIVITHLHQDPTKPRGSLSPGLLQRFFAEKFDAYLRENHLVLTLKSGGRTFNVAPLETAFPRVGEAFSEMHLSGAPEKKFRCQFWFDPSGKSHVSIRHTGISIVEDLKNYPAFGIEESIYTSGLLKGYIDADFLTPQPSRASFEENRDWNRFLIELDRIRVPLEAEIEELRAEEEEKKLTDVQKQAIRIAREILDQEQFKDVELIGGLKKKGKAAAQTGETQPTGKPTGTRSRKEGDPERPGGFRIAYREMRFEDGASKHSRFRSGVVQVNELNPDFMREKKGSAQERLAYAALMIGKEAIAFNDKSGGTDFFLEKYLSYVFQVKARMGGAYLTRSVREKKRTAREAKGSYQTRLPILHEPAEEVET